MSDPAQTEIDGLYALPASEFVAARNALVKRLKADKRKEEAAEVAALRRPTVVAWALNQVARDDPDAVALVIEATQGVVEAQREVLDGGDAKALRAATATQRGAAAEVADAAVRLAGANNADAVTATLDAALADDQLTDQLRAGTMTETLDAPAGFGFGFAVDEAASAPPKRAAATKPRRTPASSTKDDDSAADRRARAEARRVVARLEKELASAEKAVTAASRRLQQAHSELAEAERTVSDAQRRAERAAASRDQAAAALDDATEVREQALGALDEARAG